MKVLNLLNVLADLQPLNKRTKDQLDQFNLTNGVNNMYEPDLIPMQNELDRQARQQAVDEARLERHIVSAIESDFYGSEIVTETVPHDADKWKLFLGEVKKRAEGQHPDALLVGQIFLDAAVRYVRNKEENND